MPKLQIGVNSAGFFQGEKPSITLLRLEVYQVLRCGGLMVGSGKVRWNLKCDKNRVENSGIRGIWCEKIMLLAFSCSAVTVVKAFEERGGTEMCWYCEAWRVMWMSVSSYLMSFADFCLFWHVCFCNLSCPQIICFCKPQLYPTAMLIHVTLQRLHSVSNVSMLFPFDLSWTYQNSEEKRF